MNLYIFNETRRGALFGVGTYIRELTVALRQHLNICVVHLMSDKPFIRNEVRNGIRYWDFPSPVKKTYLTDYQKAMYYRNVVYLLQLHMKDKTDLIFHLNYQSGKLASELKIGFDCKIITVAHFSDWGLTVFDNLRRLRFLLKEEHPCSLAVNIKKSFEEEKMYYASVDRIVCLSEYMHEILCSDYGFDPTHITTIPNGLTDMAISNPDVILLRKKLNIAANEKIILFAGRLDEVKGLAFLIKAFREVLTVYPRCRLVIAGEGMISKYCKESRDICTKVSYTGLLDQLQLFEWYSIADVGVIPSLFEPFGYVAIEMMMHSLPIIVTATSGLNEIVDESCGLKVPLARLPDSVEIDTSLLAKKILYLLQNPAKAKTMGQNGRKRYLKEYSTEVFHRNMMQMYETLMGANR